MLSRLYWPPLIGLWPSETLVLQGTRDYVVDIEAGRHLYRLAKRPAEPYWADGCDHENVEMSAQYIPHLRRYLQSIFGKNFC